MLPCACCGVARTASNAYVYKHNGKPVRKVCNKCYQDAGKEYRRVNAASAVQRAREWRERNPEKMRRHRAQSEGKRRQRVRTPPPWFNNKEVATVYWAASFCRALGIDVHVDHIVPLLGKNVCGLHVQNNLRVIPALNNRKKGNRLPPGV